MNVLVISTVDKTLPIYELEFVRPIVDTVAEAKATPIVIHISELTTDIVADKIIISGTAYQDNKFLKYKDKITILFEMNVPMLGICAGAELLLPQDCVLETVKEIGSLVVENLVEDELTSKLDGKEVYFLHQQGIRAIPLGNDELVGLLASKVGIAAYRYKNKPIWGMQFHPEVDKKNVIAEFLTQTEE
ncbi:hypothetical protein K9M74_02585 [Candidatus Woesearchaeota archaeon]|nr:hypothetical protein [Candidatus Woesearchaeota archaeon]